MQLHTTHRNLHLTHRLATHMRSHHLHHADLEQAYYKALGPEMTHWHRFRAGAPTGRWPETLAWLHYAAPWRPFWPIHEWLWDPTLEKLFASENPEPAPTAAYPRLHLRDLLKRRNLELWELRRLIRCQKKGPPPALLYRMARGAVIPTGHCLIPILGLALRAPIRPFLPNGWSEFSKT